MFALGHLVYTLSWECQKMINLRFYLSLKVKQRLFYYFLTTFNLNFISINLNYNFKTYIPPHFSQWQLDFLNYKFLSNSYIFINSPLPDLNNLRLASGHRQVIEIDLQQSKFLTLLDWNFIFMDPRFHSDFDLTVITPQLSRSPPSRSRDQKFYGL